MERNLDQIRKFLLGVSQKLKDMKIDECKSMCWENKKSNNDNLVIISTAVLEVINDISDYLLYVEEEIAKKVNYSEEDEEKRLTENVIIPFDQDIRALTSASFEDMIKIVSNLIRRWESFPRQKIRQI